MTLRGNLRLLPTPGYHRVSSNALLAGLELTDGRLLPVSQADEARLRYHAVSRLLQLSVNGASYSSIMAEAQAGIYLPQEFDPLAGSAGHDSATAIQDAITAASGIPRGKVVLTPGTWSMESGVLIAADGVRIEGAGDGNTIIDFAPTADGAAFTFSRGASSIWHCGIAGLHFTSADTIYRKTMVKIVDARGFIAEDIGCNDGDWTGDLSLGINVYGREEIRIRDCAHLAADIPLRFNGNPNLALFSLDHSSVTGCQFVVNPTATVVGPLDDLVWDNVARTCARTVGSWLAAGIDVGTKLTVSGSDLNNGDKTVAAATALLLTFHEAVVADADDDSVTFTVRDRTAIEFSPDSVVWNTAIRDTAMALGAGAILFVTDATAALASHHVTVDNCRAEQGTGVAEYYFDFRGGNAEIQDLAMRQIYTDSGQAGVRLSGVRFPVLDNAFVDLVAGVALSMDATVAGASLRGFYHEVVSTIEGLALVKGIAFASCQDGVLTPIWSGSISEKALGRQLDGMHIQGNSNSNYGWWINTAGQVDRMTGCELVDWTTYAIFVQAGAEVRAGDCMLRRTLDDVATEVACVINTGGILRMHDSTIESDASGTHVFVGVSCDAGVLDLSDVTITAPTCEDGSHGLMIAGASVVRLHNVDITMENNANSGGIYLSGATATIFRTGRFSLTGPTADVRFAGGATQAQLNWGANQLAAGAVTVPCVHAKAGMTVALAHYGLAGTPGALRLGAIVDGTSFDIISTSATDTSIISWQILGYYT